MLAGKQPAGSRSAGGHRGAPMVARELLGCCYIHSSLFPRVSKFQCIVCWFSAALGRQAGTGTCGRARAAGGQPVGPTGGCGSPTGGQGAAVHRAPPAAPAAADQFTLPLLPCRVLGHPESKLHRTSPSLFSLRSTSSRRPPRCSSSLHFLYCDPNWVYRKMAYITFFGMFPKGLLESWPRGNAVKSPHKLHCVTLPAAGRTLKQELDSFQPHCIAAASSRQRIAALGGQRWVWAGMAAGRGCDGGGAGRLKRRQAGSRRAGW